MFRSDSFFSRSIVLRSLWIWIGVRLLIAALGIPMRTLFFPVSPAAGLVTVAIVVSVASLEMRRNDEFLLLANLGASPVRLLLLSAVAPTVAESIITALALR